MGVLLAAPWAHGAALGALSGWAGAAKTDFAAFQSWKSLNDAHTYDWGVAMWRWFQGAVVGAVSGAGFGVMLGA